MNGFPDRATIMRRFLGKALTASPDRLAAIDAVLDRAELLTAHGWKMRSWHPTSPCSPCTIKLDGYPGGKDWDHQTVSGWMDHAYRLIAPDGHPVFVSEPYGIDGAALVKLQYLYANGWDVRIRPEIALHYPGRTVAIWITKRKVGSA